MKIKLIKRRSLFQKRLLFLCMRTFIFFLCTSVFSFNTMTSFAQVKVTISTDKIVSVDEVFNIIQKQTKYRFLYPQDLFVDAPKVHLKKGEIEIKKLLNQSIQQKDINFKFSENNTIVIEKLNISQKPVSRKLQGIKISGVITDSNNQPLPGASILEKGTVNGAQSDFDGNFTLTVSNSNAVLVVSYLGFITQEIKVGEQTIFNVTLLDDTAKLEEIVVVGYGTQKKINVTGAVSKIDAQDFQNNLGPSTGQLLQGISPNLNVTLSDGDINNEADINVRGIGSINGGQPLILIDGVQGNLNRINPRDIESISVLKDAASASIYGARASFGVILISTKKAKEGDVKINYTNNFGWSTPTINTDNFITDGLEWARLSDRLSLLENTSTYLGYTEEDYAYLEARRQDPSLPSVLIKNVNGAERYVHYGNTDWWNTVFENWQPQSEHNINLSGGSKKINFYLSGRYLTRKGIYKINPDVLDTYTLRSRIVAKPADWIEIGNSVVFNDTIN